MCAGLQVDVSHSGISSLICKEVFFFLYLFDDGDLAKTTEELGLALLYPEDKWE